MNSIKKVDARRNKTGFSVTPGFIITIAAMLVLQRLFLFLGYVLSMLIHETAHYLAARKLGYDCIKIKLSVFGAVLYGDFNELTQREEIFVAAAGPVSNLILSVILIASWWIYPEIYNYTRDILTANLCIALVNILPCYPLDGGRILKSFLMLRGKASPTKLIQVLCSVVGGVLFLLFVLSLFTGHNLFNVGIFAVFIFSGGYSISRDSMYQKLFIGGKIKRRIAKGAEVRFLAVSEGITAHEAYKKCDHSHYCIIFIMRGDCLIGKTDVFRLEELIKTAPNLPLTATNLLY